MAGHARAGKRMGSSWTPDGPVGWPARRCGRARLRGAGWLEIISRALGQRSKIDRAAPPAIHPGARASAAAYALRHPAAFQPFAPSETPVEPTIPRAVLSGGRWCVFCWAAVWVPLTRTPLYGHDTELRHAMGCQRTLVPICRARCGYCCVAFGYQIKAGDATRVRPLPDAM